MSLRDYTRLARLALTLRGIWYKISHKNPITSKKVLDTIRVLYQFFTGKTLLFVICMASAWSAMFTGSLDWLCGPTAAAEPTQVAPAPVYELIPPKPEKSVLVATNIVHEPQSFDVQIHVGDGSIGSGTLYRPDAIVTVHHLFRESKKDIHVTFPDGRTVNAFVFYEDKTYDLAVLVIPPVEYEPAPLSQEKEYESVETHGYSNGKFQHKSHSYIRWTRPTVQTALVSTLVVSGGVRPGDSGCGIHNRSGLYGVAWGSVDNETYGTSGSKFRDFISRANSQLDSRPDRLVVISDPATCRPCASLEPILFRLIGEGYQIECRKPVKGDGMIPKLLFFAGEKQVTVRTGFQSYNFLATALRKPDEPQSVTR